MTDVILVIAIKVDLQAVPRYLVKKLIPKLALPKKFQKYHPRPTFGKIQLFKLIYIGQHTLDYFYNELSDI